jgi:hypothetical protein
VLVAKDNTKVGKRLTFGKFTELSHASVSPRGGGFYVMTEHALEKLDRSRRIAV